MTRSVAWETYGGQATHLVSCPREAEEGTGLRGGKAAGVNGIRGHPPTSGEQSVGGGGRRHGSDQNSEP